LEILIKIDQLFS